MNAEGHGQVCLYPCPSVLSFVSHFSKIKPRPPKLHRMDHDARFKMLLEAAAILRGFFDAFLSEVARFIDFKIRDSR